MFSANRFRHTINDNKMIAITIKRTTLMLRMFAFALIIFNGYNQSIAQKLLPPARGFISSQPAETGNTD